MDEYSNLIEAIASLLWPILATMFIFVFRSQIGEAIGRLKKGKLLGQEIELSDSLKTLQRVASQASEEVALLPKNGDLKEEEGHPSENGETKIDSIIRSIIQEATNSPKAALLILSAEIEREARRTLASIGKLNGRTNLPIAQAIRDLDSHYGLPRDMSSSLKLFWDTRNQIIHGDEPTEGNVLSAIDSGVTILRSLQALPRGIYVVHRTGVTIFSDPDCSKLIKDAYGIILESRSPSGVQTSFRIFPTTRRHFEVGKAVAWEWNMDKTWSQAWYRDGSGEGATKQAWHSSAEFIGRHLDDV